MVSTPLDKSTYFDEEILDELERDIISFSSKGSTTRLESLQNVQPPSKFTINFARPDLKFARLAINLHQQTFQFKAYIHM